MRLGNLLSLTACHLTCNWSIVIHTFNLCKVHLAKFKVWMTIVVSGWNVWVWLVDVVSRRWVWLVGVGGIYGCDFVFNVFRSCKIM